MKGLELSRKYYDAYRQQFFAAFPPELARRAACGLVGEGSQCFGFDDALSQDHDFAPGFCVWLSQEDDDQYGAALQTAYDHLPASFLGFSRENLLAPERLGVTTIKGFYRQFTGCPDGLPESNMDWLSIPERNLATATNGEVFAEGDGRFSAVRCRLLEFYPEDVRRKKIAARAAVMAQAGQYNLLRVIKREDSVAALLSLARFTEASLSMIYLLNKRYTPFYKWAFHGLAALPLLANTCQPLLEQGSQLMALLREGKTAESGRMAFDLTEGICTAVAEELRRQHISAATDGFLQAHLPDIMAGIEDPQLRALHPLADCAN